MQPCTARQIHNCVRILMTLSLFLYASQSCAGAWPSVEGSTYTELSVATLSASKISNGSSLDGIPTQKTTNSNLRLYTEIFLTKKLAFILNTPILAYHRFGDAKSTRFGDVGLGLRYHLRSTEKSALAASIGITLPTVGHERGLGSIQQNPEGVYSFANDATGSLEILPSLLYSIHKKRSWIDASVGYAARTHYVDQFAAAIQLYRPISKHLAGTLGLHSRINLGDAQARSDLAILANGVGETAQFIGTYLRADWRFSSGIGLGVGLDNAFWLKNYPFAPGFSARISFVGKLW